MNIYLIKRSDWGYDEFNGFVMVANTEKEALEYLESTYNKREHYNEWPNNGEKTATLIGTTDKYNELTIILSSFNAG